MALSHLYTIFSEELFSLNLPCVAEVPSAERKLFLKMLERRLNSPLTSSCGRLFDAVSALVGLRQRVSYEGQAAIELEAIAEAAATTVVYPFDIAREEDMQVVDFREMLRAIVTDVVAGRPRDEIACCFHNSMAAMVAEVCKRIRTETGMDRVVLSGGVFQNKLLSEGVFNLLADAGFHVFTQRLAPPNDGGLALGQAIIAGRSILCV
jgi:hydrogenase maturation protein HypF